MNTQKPKLIVIEGPTGSGKTSLAVFLCQKFNGEIVSADSRQIYKEMNIGTGKELDSLSVNHKTQITKYKQISNPESITKTKPSRGTRRLSLRKVVGATVQGVPIHCVDLVDPGEKYTVSDFKQDAEKAIEDIISRGKTPFLVGGTGLYIDAVVDNFNFIAESDDQIRWLFRHMTLEDLVRQLLELDPDAANEVDLKNRRRVERALEVSQLTGIPFTKQKTRGERKYDVLKIAPKIEREELNKKINKRVGEMIQLGLVDEVCNLAKKYGWENEAMTGIGYREWKPLFVSPKYEALNPKQIQNIKSPKLQRLLHEAYEQIKINTRHYAKRQMTWFKRSQEINWVRDCEEAERLVKIFLAD